MSKIYTKNHSARKLTQEKPNYQTATERKIKTQISKTNDCNKVEALSEYSRTKNLPKHNNQTKAEIPAFTPVGYL